MILLSAFNLGAWNRAAWNGVLPPAQPSPSHFPICLRAGFPAIATLATWPECAEALALPFVALALGIPAQTLALRHSNTCVFTVDLRCCGETTY